MAKSYVVTNRRKLDAFLRNGGALEDLVLRVGVLSGKPKYPKGHVGSRSRDASRRDRYRKKIAPEELHRRKQIKEARALLVGLSGNDRKEAVKRMRAAFKAAGMSSRSLGRRSSAQTPVARVAGVLASEEQYHLRAVRQRRPLLRREIEQLRAVLLGGGDVARMIQMIGDNTKDAIRGSLQATGHTDTRRLLRNTQYEIVSKSRLSSYRAEQKAAREARKGRRRG